MGKFTIVTTEEAESSTDSVGQTTSAAQEVGAQGAADSLDETFTLKSTQPKRRGRQPAASNKQKFTSTVAENPANYAMWSQVLIASGNTVVVTWLGADCAMEKREAEMMEPPIARMLARMPVSASQKVATFIDPMVVLIALGMWGNRIIRVQREKRGNGITPAEFERASGITNSPNVSRSNDTSRTSINSTEREYAPNVEPDIPRTKIEVNPNGVPVAISEQMGDL